VRESWADAREKATLLGRELLPLGDLLEGVTALRLNGERLDLSSSVVPNTNVHSVLDRVERLCRESPGPLAIRLEQAAASLPSGVPRAHELRELLRRAAVSREETEGSGSVLCFTGSASRAHASDSSEAFAARFAETRDLAELGQLRYFSVRQGDAASGEEHDTKVLALFTQGSFRLDSLEPPPNGDAPGSDSRVIPRPPDSVRLFSAEAMGAPYSVRIYETSAPPAIVLAFYDRAMHDFTSPLDSSTELGRAYLKGGRPVLVTLDADDAKTLVTLSEVGVHDAPPHIRQPE